MILSRSHLSNAGQCHWHENSIKGWFSSSYDMVSYSWSRRFDVTKNMDSDGLTVKQSMICVTGWLISVITIGNELSFLQNDSGIVTLLATKIPDLPRSLVNSGWKPEMTMTLRQPMACKISPNPFWLTSWSQVMQDNKIQASNVTQRSIFFG